MMPFQQNSKEWWATRQQKKRNQAKAKAMPKAKAAALSRRFRLLGKQAPSGWYKFS